GRLVPALWRGRGHGGGGRSLRCFQPSPRCAAQPAGFRVGQRLELCRRTHAVAVTIAILLTEVRVAREYNRGVVFRLGRYTVLRSPSLCWIVPLGIERFSGLVPVVGL